MTFFQFCTRPEGFGKTPWPQFYVIFIFVLIFVLHTVFGSETWPRIITGFFAAAITAVMIYGTWRNYKGKQA